MLVPGSPGETQSRVSSCTWGRFYLHRKPLVDGQAISMTGWYPEYPTTPICCVWRSLVTPRVLDEYLHSAAAEWYNAAPAKFTSVLDKHE